MVSIFVIVYSYIPDYFNPFLQKPVFLRAILITSRNYVKPGRPVISMNRGYVSRVQRWKSFRLVKNNEVGLVVVLLFYAMRFIGKVAWYECLCDKMIIQ